MPALDARFNNSFKASQSAASAFPLLNLPLGPLGPAVVAAAAKKDMEAAAAAAASAGGGGKKSSDNSPQVPLNLPALMSGLNAHNLNHHAAMSAAGFPMMDMSSTQALLNIVRSASAQNAQQLESYLRGASSATSGAAAAGASAVAMATKRPAETCSSAASSSPLDLSASMAKRPYLEAATREEPGRGFRDLFGLKSPVTDQQQQQHHHLPLTNGKKSPSARAPSGPPPLLSQTSPRSAGGEKRVSAAKIFSSSSSTSSSATAALPIACRLTCAADTCSPGAVQVKSWSVGDVVDFVKSVDLCAEYAEVSELFSS